MTPSYVAGDPTAIHVQSSESETLSVLDNAEALDSIIAQCNRKGLRERALQSALQKDQAQLGESLQADLPRLVVSAHPGVAETDNTNGVDTRTIQVSSRSTSPFWFQGSALPLQHLSVLEEHVLCCMLCGVLLCCAVLSWDVLCCAGTCGAVLGCAVLCGGAMLHCAVQCDTVLCCAMLYPFGPLDPGPSMLWLIGSTFACRRL